MWEHYHVDKSVPVPLYYQLKQQLLEQIRTGALKAGDSIPPELDFCRELDISRTTVRQALQELTSEGYLIRCQGRGTEVAAPKIQDAFLNQLRSFRQEMEEKGLEPSTRVLRLKKKSAGGAKQEEAARVLGLTAEQEVISIRRIRYADGSPVVYVETWLPAEECRPILNCDLERESLYDRMEKLCGIHVRKVTREIEAAAASGQTAQYLEIRSGEPLHHVKTAGYDGNGRAVEYSCAWYRGDKTKFTIELYR